MSERPFPDPEAMGWDFRPEGYSWGERTRERLKPIEEFKLEVTDGKLLWDDEMRLLAGLLIENVGLDRLVRLGDLDAWREAVRKLSA